jgi:polysaccharide biosynthesis/export protein
MLRYAQILFLLVLNYASTVSMAQLPEGRTDDSERRTIRGQQPGVTAFNPVVDADYVLGPGDVVRVQIAEEPDLTGTFQVTEGGFLGISSLGLVKAAGHTAPELADIIRKAYQQAEILNNPIVTVYVQEYRSRKVMVLGAVARPSVYSLDKRTSLLEVVSNAGGLAPNAGQIIVTQRNGTVRRLDAAQLANGGDPALNIQIDAGDVVSVSTAPVVYVVGAVTKPGGFVVQDSASGLTILQALAMAEGLQSTAAPNRAIVLRNKQAGKGREQVPVNIGKLLEGKAVDQTLSPNDILFVPESGSKKTARALGRMAEQAAVGIATYGVGLRVSSF